MAKEPAQAIAETAPASEPASNEVQPAAPTEAPAQTATDKPGEKKVERSYDLSKFADIFDLIDNETDKRVRSEIGAHVRKLLTKHKLDHYTTLMLYDNCDQISHYHANQIYEAASSAGSQQDIFLILQSGGGQVEPAYLISKTCHRLAKGKFIVAVPRRAKSAATLITLGADEIHMGLMSELGPVDPQIDGYPALGLINSLEVLAEIVCKQPDSAELFARYLSRKLELENLGYFVRVPASAVQYGERLLRRNATKLPPGATAQTIADKLVNHYKDHGFVIDMDESKELLGSLIHQDTAEYRAANEIYKFLYFMEYALGTFKNSDLWFVGDVAGGSALRKRKK